MSKRTLLLMVLAAVAIIAAVAIFLFRGGDDETTALLSNNEMASVTAIPPVAVRSYRREQKPLAVATAATVEQSSSDAVAELAPNVTSDPAPILELTPERSPESVAPLEPGTLRVHEDQTLATVNGVAIQGKDLGVFGRTLGGKALVMEEQQYQHLLNAAIERVLLEQRAQTDGIELTEDQKRQLEVVKQSVLARSGGEDNAVPLNYTGSMEEQAEFEAREAQAQLLLNTMLEQRGVALPNVTQEQVKQYYEAHMDELGALPKEAAARGEAWVRLDGKIRQLLAPTVMLDYQTKRQQLIEELKKTADIAFKEL